MNDAFGDLAPYYDRLYADKDYAGEARLIAEILGNHDIVGAHVGDRILDLGCGTGAHMLELKRLGYQVVGIDHSEAMVAIARSKGLTVHEADARLSILANPAFDAVLCLFHVMSYQLTVEDVVAVLQTAHGHLKPGGLFIFDYWDVTAVSLTPPQVRIKRMQADRCRLTRIAEPVLLPFARVDVDYTLFYSTDDRFEMLQEKHHLRCWYESEIWKACTGLFTILALQRPVKGSYSAQVIAQRL